MEGGDPWPCQQCRGQTNSYYTLCQSRSKRGAQPPFRGGLVQARSPHPREGSCQHHAAPLRSPGAALALVLLLPSDLSTSVSLALPKINRRGYSTPTRAQEGSDSCHRTQTYKTLSCTCVMEADAFYLQAVSFSW